MRVHPRASSILSCKVYFCRQLKRFWSSLRKRISDEMITQRRTSTTARIDHHMSAWLHGRVNTEENHLSFYFERQRKTILVTSSVRQFGDYFWKAKAKEASAPVLFLKHTTMIRKENESKAVIVQGLLVNWCYEGSRAPHRGVFTVVLRATDLIRYGDAAAWWGPSFIRTGQNSLRLSRSGPSSRGRSGSPAVSPSARPRLMA